MGVRTDHIGNKKTEDMGYTLDWAYALEKRVTNGTKTTIYQPAFERPVYDVRALQDLRDLAQDRAQVEG